MSFKAERVMDEWIIHYLQSTANFATHSKVLTWLLGILNFQVEHHFFPKVSHVNYPILNRIVKDTCEEYNLKYKDYRRFNEALRFRIYVIRRMST